MFTLADSTSFYRFLFRQKEESPDNIGQRRHRKMTFFRASGKTRKCHRELPPVVFERPVRVKM